VQLIYPYKGSQHSVTAGAPSPTPSRSRIVRAVREGIQLSRGWPRLSWDDDTLLIDHASGSPRSSAPITGLPHCPQLKIRRAATFDSTDDTATQQSGSVNAKVAKGLFPKRLDEKAGSSRFTAWSSPSSVFFVQEGAQTFGQSEITSETVLCPSRL